MVRVNDISEVLFWIVLLQGSVSSKIIQVSPCKADVHGKLLNLEPLQGLNGKPRFVSVFNSRTYMFNPCRPYRAPPSEEVDYQHIGQCRQVALCREQVVTNGTRIFSPLGTQGTVRFKRAGPTFKEIIQLKFKGRGSEKRTRSYIILVCAPERKRLADARFDIFVDHDGADGDDREVFGELHHRCACPGGCPEGTILNDTIPDFAFDGTRLLIGQAKDSQMLSVSGAIRPMTKRNSEEIQAQKQADTNDDGLPLYDDGESFVHINDHLVSSDGEWEYEEFFKEVARRKLLDPNFELQEDNSSEGDWSSSELGDSSDDRFDSSSSEEERLRKLKEQPKIPDSHALMVLMVFLLALIGAAALTGAICYCNRNKTGLIGKNNVPGLRKIMHDSTEDIHSNTMINNEYFDYSIAPEKKPSLPVLSNCAIPKEEVDTGQRLGGGLFGDTYIGEWRDYIVVVKRITVGIHNDSLSRENQTWMEAEVKALSKLRHKHIVATVGVCFETKCPLLVCEHIEGRTVKHLLNEKADYITWPMKIKMLLQTVEGLIYLHHSKPPVIHRDLRCANLIVDEKEKIRVCDFGLVKMSQRLREHCNANENCYCLKEFSACPATIRWTAPEVLQHSEAYHMITPACDVYSFGMIMWEMATHMDPFSEVQNEEKVMEIVKEGLRPVMPGCYDVLPQYRDLMMDCWQNDPKQRPSFKKVAVRLKEVQSAINSFHKRKMIKTSPKLARLKTVSFTHPDAVHHSNIF